MGADLIINYLAMPADCEPNWDAARRRLAEMTDDDIVRTCRESLDKDVEGIEDIWLPGYMTDVRDIVDEVEDMWENGRHDTAMFTVGGIDIMVTGEMSWGDCSDSVRALEIFQCLGLDGVAGFIT